MSVGLAGCGFLGIAIETTSGTYAAPTKYVPIRSESLAYQQDTVWRRPIAQTVDITAAIPGNVHVEGDVELEVTPDVACYFHHIMRGALVKTGAGPYVYTYTGVCGATGANTASGKTASITIVRNTGQVFGYVGCLVGQASYTVDSGALVGTYSIIGTDEASQSVPVPTWGTAVPFGAGEIALEVPTGAQIFDTEGFDVTINDNAEPQYRMVTGAGARGARFVKFGEREVTMSVERDFDTRTEYDAFKAYTAQSITWKATKSATEEMTFLMGAAIKDTYEVGLSGQGDLVRASVSYQAIRAASGNAYSMVVKTAENIA
jgi:hypothetical protein